MVIIPFFMESCACQRSHLAEAEAEGVLVTPLSYT